MNNPVTRFVGTFKKPQWQLMEDYTRFNIKVPKFFIYDKASCPRFLWWYLPPFGVYEGAALIHDYIYVNKGYVEYKPMTRKEADQIFYMLMIEDGVPNRRAKKMYLAVRAFGWVKW